MNATTTVVSFDCLSEDKNLLKYVMLWLKRVYPNAGNTFPTLKRINSETYLVKCREEAIGVIRKGNFNVTLTDGEYNGKIVVSTRSTPWGIVVRGVKAVVNAVTTPTAVKTKILAEQVDTILIKVAAGFSGILTVLYFMTY